MSFRARFAVLAGTWTIAVAGLVLAIPLLFRGRLPDPVAVHWGLSGFADGSCSFAAFVALPVSVWGLLAVLALVPLVRGRNVLQRRLRGTAGAVLAAGAVLTAGLAVLTTWANLDVAQWRQARSVSWQVLVLMALAGGAGWAGWRIARLGPDELSGPAEGEPPRLRSGERLVWVASGTSRWLTGLSGIAVLVPGICLGFALFGNASTSWVLLLITAVAAAVLFALSSVRVRVGPEGVSVAFGPQRWPVRRIPLSEVAVAWTETRHPATWGGWGYRGLLGNATIMLRGGECLVLRYDSGSELGISVDDAERGAALINALLDDATPRVH